MRLHDLSFAVRTLRRSPAFTLAAVLTLALGFDASAAIFSVAYTVLLRPLPCTDPARLEVMYMDLRARHTFGIPFSNENYADIRNGSTGVFEDMAAVRTVRQVRSGRHPGTDSAGASAATSWTPTACRSRWPRLPRRPSGPAAQCDAPGTGGSSANRTTCQWKRAGCIRRRGRRSAGCSRRAGFWAIGRRGPVSGAPSNYRTLKRVPL